MPKKNNTADLGLSGPGVAPVRIAKLDRLAKDYAAVRDARMEMTPGEVKAKQKLLDALHENASGEAPKLARDPDGVIRYVNEDLDIYVETVPGKENVKVRKASAMKGTDE